MTTAPTPQAPTPQAPTPQFERFTHHTPVERIVIDFMAQGMPVKDIKLDPDPGADTVRLYVRKILQKADVKDASDLVSVYAATFTDPLTRHDFVTYGVVPPRACQRFAENKTLPSTREARIGGYIAAGLTTDQIAVKDHCTPDVVRNTIKHLKIKLGTVKLTDIAALFTSDTSVRSSQPVRHDNWLAAKPYKTTGPI